MPSTATTSPRCSCRPRRSSGSPLTRTSPANSTSFTWAPVGTASTSLSSCPRRMVSSPGRIAMVRTATSRPVRPARAVSPVRTVPGSRTAARTASSPSRSRWMVLSTEVSRAMPPGWGRVVMTHRAMGTPNRSRTEPRSASRPRSSSSPAPSRTTLARNRRRSHVPSVPVETSDSRMRGLSWNGPGAPSHCSHSVGSGTSSSAGVSYVGATSPCSVAARSSTRRPSQPESTSSSRRDGAVGQDHLHAAVGRGAGPTRTAARAPAGR